LELLSIPSEHCLLRQFSVGVDNNSNLPDLLNETNFVIQPPIDALEEFKVQTNAYSAEFGRGNGAIVNAVIKSGKNQLHGSLWEFLRNEKLDSRNYFDDRGAKTPAYKQNNSAELSADRSSFQAYTTGRTRRSSSSTTKVCGSGKHRRRLALSPQPNGERATSRAC